LTGSDVRVLVWLTDQQPGDFSVELSGPAILKRMVRPVRTTLDFPAPKVEKKKTVPAAEPAKEGDEEEKEKKETKKPPPEEKDQHYFRYMAHLDELPFDANIRYRVKLGSKVIREGTFRTRATADKSVRCVLVGDLAQGRPAQKSVAFQISLKKPDLLLALGDIVYSTGRVSQYMANFWHTYNDVPLAGPKAGAPLMATVPFYAVLGNHDIGAKLPKIPDALGAYYFFVPPKGGPGEGPWITPLGNDEPAVSKFRQAAADSYPNLDAYSFDYGPAHFVAINNNKGVSIDAPRFRRWLLRDLKTSTATWKFVCYHVPGFQSAMQHYPEQQSRLLEPIFEEGGVDITFAGHVHNYQRSLPLKFVPEGGIDKKGKVFGRFKIDRTFDGVQNTRPQGVIHIVAGGGGAGLYGPGLDRTAPKLQKEHGANYANFTDKMVADRHTFVVLDYGPARLVLRAFAANGEELDHIVINKGT
jgi:predicted phosphodiesterase